MRMRLVAREAKGERGQVVVLFALLIPVLLGIGAIVIGIGNWYTHAKHLQTKADASALAGGGVWGFPCATDSDGLIETQARNYVGPHTQADGSVYNTTTLNPQVGGVGADDIHVVLNGPGYFDDDSNPFPTEKTTPPPAPGGTTQICDSYTLDVKATESNSFPLFSLLPIFPDIKRKARVEIREVESLSGLLPISVRVPKPVSAAAVFYDENTGNILPGGVSYFCEKSGITGLPAGLSGWTTLDPLNPSGLCSSWTQVNVAPTTGVAIATSVRPACSATIMTNCFEDAGFTTVDQLCNQGSGARVQCFFDSDPTGASQVIASGLQFIRGYQALPSPNAVGNGPPALGSAYLSPGVCAGGYTSGYFAAVTSSCTAVLNAELELGTCLRGPGECIDDPTVNPPRETRTTSNTELKYTLVHGTGNNDDICNFGPTCDLNPSWSASVTLPPQYPRYSVALRVRLKETFVPGRPGCSNSNFNGQCEWYFTSAGRVLTQPSNATIFAQPVQRPFMGDDDRSGPVKFLRLAADANCDGGGLPNYIDNEAGSMQLGVAHCFYMEMGLKGGLAKDQDEPPIAFNITGASQSALVDCDDNSSGQGGNLREEIEYACQSPTYSVNKFDTTPLCPSTSQFFVTPKAAPFDDWAPFRCVMTQTTASATPGQLLQGFNLRFFGQASNPVCPTENTTWALPNPAPWTKGRNYWHDANNVIDAYTFAQDDPAPARSNRLRDDDPRLINLFMTPYNSFGGAGQATFPIVNFGTFYVTGYGKVTGGGLTIDDPCSGGDGDPSLGAGRKPPPDLPTNSNGVYVWGHFVNNVVPTPGATPSDRLCAPAESFMPCVAVLVE
jgi:hypothetical protein